MNDRELLELAAKAARLKIDKSEYNGGGSGNTGFDILGNAVLDWHNGKKWNPLRDDGDALRLAVKLKLDVMFFEGFGEVIVESNDASVRCSELYGADTMPATRRAIVRAAAEMGRRVL